MKEEEREKYLIGYLEKSLSPNEEHQVEKWLAEDATLRKEIEELKLVQEDLLRLGRVSFAEKVAEWESQHSNKSIREHSNYPRYLSLAAVITLIAVASIWLFRPTDPTSLYQEYYSPYEDLTSTRGNNSTTALSAGMEAYNQGNFSQATSYLTEYIENNNDPLAWLYLGVSHLELNEFKQAELAFRAAASGQNTSQQAIWYEALTHLKSGNTTSAIKYFEEIAANPNHYKQKEALDLLDELN